MPAPATSRPHYRRQWHVPSSTGRGAGYTVSEDHAGAFSCSCPAWTRHTPRRDCKHVDAARDTTPDAGEGAPPRGAPRVDWRALVRYAAVDRVTPRLEAGRLVEIRVPLTPAGPEWTGFAATIAADLDALGMPWREVQAVCDVARRNPRRAVLDYVTAHGRTVRDRWEDGRGWTGRRTERAPNGRA